MRLHSATLTAVATMATLFAASDALASHDSPLYRATSEYRDAVRHFERSVLRAPYFDHYQERIVDRLEDSTSRLRSAARHPDRFDRLARSWYEVQSLHPQVERAIFSHPGCPSTGDLAVCWQRVDRALECVANEIAACRQPVVPRLRAAPPAPVYRQPPVGVPYGPQLENRRRQYYYPEFGPQRFDRQPNVWRQESQRRDLLNDNRPRANQFAAPRWGNEYRQPNQNRYSDVNFRENPNRYSQRSISAAQIGALISRFVR